MSRAEGLTRSRRLLFVAKHLFQAKGGVLLLEAFRLARSAGVDLR